jgi:hypothetical protein
VRQIARSIESFGFNVPVLVDGQLKVIAGHGRVMACQLLGWREVPTICLDHLNEAQAKAFMIADNRLTENSEWDARLLAEQLKELSTMELDFSLEATGFEMGEIDLHIEGLTPEPERDDPADMLPEVQTGPAVTRPGDVWLLGPQGSSHQANPSAADKAQIPRRSIATMERISHEARALTRRIDHLLEEFEGRPF